MEQQQLMNMHSPDPAKAYRKVDLDARIEASSGGDLTAICLEEAVLALGQALLALERNPVAPPTEPLSRAHGIALYMGRTVDPDSALFEPMTQFFGGLAASIGANMRSPSAREIAQIKDDFADLLEAARRT